MKIQNFLIKSLKNLALRYKTIIQKEFYDILYINKENKQKFFQILKEKIENLALEDSYYYNEEITVIIDNEFNFINSIPNLSICLSVKNIAIVLHCFVDYTYWYKSENQLFFINNKFSNYDSDNTNIKYTTNNDLISLELSLFFNGVYNCIILKEHHILIDLWGKNIQILKHKDFIILYRLIDINKVLESFLV